MDIKIICWNCQRDASPKFGVVLKNILQTQKPDILVLMETRISGKKADEVIRRTTYDCSYRVEAKGFSGGIWMIWKEQMMIDVVKVST